MIRSDALIQTSVFSLCDRKSHIAERVISASIACSFPWGRESYFLWEVLERLFPIGPIKEKASLDVRSSWKPNAFTNECCWSCLMKSECIAGVNAEVPGWLDSRVACLFIYSLDLSLFPVLIFSALPFWGTWILDIQLAREDRLISVVGYGIHNWFAC